MRPALAFALVLAGSGAASGHGVDPEVKRCVRRQCAFWLYAVTTPDPIPFKPFRDVDPLTLTGLLWQTPACIRATEAARWRPAPDLSLPHGVQVEIDETKRLLRSGYTRDPAPPIPTRSW